MQLSVVVLGGMQHVTHLSVGTSCLWERFVCRKIETLFVNKNSFICGNASSVGTHCLWERFVCGNVFCFWEHSDRKLHLLECSACRRAGCVCRNALSMGTFHLQEHPVCGNTLYVGTLCLCRPLCLQERFVCRNALSVGMHCLQDALSVGTLYMLACSSCGKAMTVEIICPWECFVCGNTLPAGKLCLWERSVCVEYSPPPIKKDTFLNV